MKLFDLTIGLTNLDEISGLIAKNRASGQGSSIATLDVLGLDLALRNEQYRQCLQGADTILLDGAGLTLVAKIMGEIPPPRMPGADFFLTLCQFSVKKQWRIFLYGAKPKVLTQLNRRLRVQFPNIIICGSVDGYSYEKNEVIAMIKRCQPDLLFVAIGLPAQELFIKECLTKHPVPLCMGVGGSFDVHSGLLQRAPQTWQNLGLEWLFRLLQEPRRFFRILRIPRFFIGLLLSRLFVERN